MPVMYHGLYNHGMARDSTRRLTAPPAALPEGTLCLPPVVVSAGHPAAGNCIEGIDDLIPSRASGTASGWLPETTLESRPNPLLPEPYVLISKAMTLSLPPSRMASGYRMRPDFSITTL